MQNILVRLRTGIRYKGFLKYIMY